MLTVIEKSFRRLDSLAKVFKGNDTCAALVVTNSKILVTSNDANDTRISYMDSVKNFLVKIVQGKINCEDVEGLNSFNIPIEIVKSYFKSSERFSMKVFKEAQINDHLLSKICLDVLNKENLHSIPPAKKTKYNKNVFNYRPSEELLQIVNLDQECIDIINKGMGYISTSLRKVGDYLLTIEQVDWIEFIKQENFEFLENKAKKDNVLHAEMRIITEVIKDNTLITNSNNDSINKLYIGITWLCCLDCHATITALNEYFKENNNKINFLFKGAHNKDFGDKWREPDFLDELNIRTRYEELKTKLSLNTQVLEGTASSSDSEVLKNSLLKSLALGVLTSNFGSSIESKNIEILGQESDIEDYNTDFLELN
jgi:hypothetical protein